MLLKSEVSSVLRPSRRDIFNQIGSIAIFSKLKKKAWNSKFYSMILPKDKAEYQLDSLQVLVSKINSCPNLIRMSKNVYSNSNDCLWFAY